MKHGAAWLPSARAVGCLSFTAEWRVEGGHNITTSRRVARRRVAGTGKLGNQSVYNRSSSSPIHSDTKHNRAIRKRRNVFSVCPHSAVYRFSPPLSPYTDSPHFSFSQKFCMTNFLRSNLHKQKTNKSVSIFAA